MKLSHFYREEAENIENDIISALNYNAETVQLYMLLKYQNKYRTLLYDSKKQVIREPNPEFILNLIECNSSTEIAIVDIDQVERLAHKLLVKWCNDNEIVSEEIERICTLYLKPNVIEDDIKELF